MLTDEETASGGQALENTWPPAILDAEAEGAAGMDWETTWDSDRDPGGSMDPSGHRPYPADPEGPALPQSPTPRSPGMVLHTQPWQHAADLSGTSGIAFPCCGVFGSLLAVRPGRAPFWHAQLSSPWLQQHRTY